MVRKAKPSQALIKLSERVELETFLLEFAKYAESEKLLIGQFGMLPTIHRFITEWKTKENRLMQTSSNVTYCGPEIEKPEMPKKGLPLGGAFTAAINRASEENKSNTPDFVLGETLAVFLDALHRAINSRDKWYGISPSPGGSKGVRLSITKSPVGFWLKLDNGDAQALIKIKGELDPIMEELLDQCAKQGQMNSGAQGAVRTDSPFPKDKTYEEEKPIEKKPCIKCRGTGEDNTLKEPETCNRCHGRGFDPCDDEWAEKIRKAWPIHGMEEDEACETLIAELEETLHQANILQDEKCKGKGGRR